MASRELLQKVKSSYEHTIYASYVGYITQAIVNNFVPLLFLTLAMDYDLTLDRITLITTVNFAVQLLVDFVSAKYIDVIGYRRAVVFAHVAAALGLIGLAVFPTVLGDAYAGIILSVVLYAIGGGIIEVLISPIVEACPTEKKEAAMSLLHSFYCWVSSKTEFTYWIEPSLRSYLRNLLFERALPENYACFDDYLKALE